MRDTERPRLEFSRVYPHLPRPASPPASHPASRSQRPLASAACLGAALLLAASVGWRDGAAQSLVPGQTAAAASNPVSRQTGNATNPLGPGLDSLDSPFPDTTRQKRNGERQRRIVSDTQRLVALANQLKAEIAASGAASMTPEMLRQMDEIEKLARSVKDKMRE